MTAALLALCLLSPPPDYSLPATDPPSIWIGGKDVTGRCHHAAQGLGLASAWQEVEVLGGWNVLHLEVMSGVEHGLRERHDIEDFHGRSFYLDSWSANRYHIRAWVRGTWGVREVTAELWFSERAF